jgi:hypothetical protein
MNDVWGVPFYYLEEFIEAMNDKAEKLSQAVKSKSGNTQTF